MKIKERNRLSNNRYEPTKISESTKINSYTFVDSCLIRSFESGPMSRFSKTKLFKILIIGALFVLLIFINPRSIFDPVRSGFAAALSPFQKVFYSASIGLENTKDFLGSVGQIKRENERLIRENQELLAENSILVDIRNENSMLREQIGLLPRDRYELISAFVVSQDPNGMGNWLEINRGSYDGIEEGMPVIVSKGILVGKVQEVGVKTSKVVLLTNPKSTVNAMTSENGAKGVVKGEYGLGIIFDMILQTDALQSGDSVVTSGVGGEVPRGLYIGTVQDVHPSDDQLFQQTTVTAPIQISKLQVVFVIKNVK